MTYYTQEDIMDDLRRRVDSSTQRQTARSLGFTAAFINDVIHGRRDLTLKLANALGYTLIPDRYTKKEG